MTKDINCNEGEKNNRDTSSLYDGRSCNSRVRNHGGQLPNHQQQQQQQLNNLSLPDFAYEGGAGAYRVRSGSFNPTCLVTKGSSSDLLSHPEKCALSRERSYSDVKDILHGHLTVPARSRRPSVILGSDESITSDDLENVQCFLPTGMLLDVSVHPDDELFQIKHYVLSVATADETFPLRGCLNPDPNCYHISYVSQNGIRVEVIDDSKTLRELNPFLSILKFNLRSKDRAQHLLKRHVGQLIGIDLRRFDKMMNCEVNDFRWRMKIFANKLAQERRARLKASWREKIMYQYPPRLVMNPITKTKGEVIKVDLRWEENVETEIPGDITAEELVEKLGHKFNYKEDYCQKCCIKTIGEASFLLGNHKLSDYAFIQENDVPLLVVLSLDSIEVETAHEAIYISLDKEARSLRDGTPSSSPQVPSSPSAPASPRSLPRKSSLTSMSLTNLSSPFQFNIAYSNTVEKTFKIRIEALNLGSEIVNGTAHKLGLQVGLFHGGRPLCCLQTIFLRVPQDRSALLEVNQDIEFDIYLANVPRMAKLCFGLFERRKANQYPVLWVNTNVFDYTAKLRKRDTLHMWEFFLGVTMPTHEMLSPLRSSFSNPNTKDSTSIVLCIHDDDNVKIQYPTFKSTPVAGSLKSMSPIPENSSSNGTQNWSRIQKLYGQELVNIMKHDPLYELTVQEKDLVWKMREYCLHNMPRLLPRVIDCVTYNDRFQVEELHYLLERWPLLSPEDALLLLDYAYPDEQVRSFAVKCLREASDDKVKCYLIQLGQALKHESYFQCDLVYFLLERALHNQHIGHFLFWELKAEMNSPTVGLLYGLILEAYLVAAPEHLKMLEHQLTFLEKCRSTHVNVQKMEISSGRNYEKAKNRFVASTRSQFCMSQSHQRNFINPLNPSLKCKRLVLDRCRLMNSKMRPQMLSFENSDVNLYSKLEDIAIMFKKGDDLRQDRLTLQLLTVMDRIWKEDEGMDLKMNVYRAMSTGVNEGFIEVVGKAETVCKIQAQHADKLSLKLKSTAALKKGVVLAWLRGHNKSVKEMKAAQEEFTKSCAGYCVATYILGIADRHNDNIMVRTNGQLFHIDFGHFLGNYKHKFGIKRERVPMVLPAEFVEVITVPDYGNANNFEFFRQLCEKAFLTIRRRANLIISLLSMMISTGLPELNSEQDLNIVRTTLHLEASEEQEALEIFRKDFTDSLKNSWTISLNWYLHMVNQMRSIK